MNINNYHSIYFIGIGGIGMSALARWFNLQGKLIAGYDKTATPLTDALIEEGIDIHFVDNINLIPKKILQEKQRSLIVYTPAIPKDHKEFNYLKENGFEVMKRSQVLGLITSEKFTIAVAGTHGKTTTSSMIAHILHEAKMNSVGFLGGVVQNYDNNLIMYGEDKEDIKVIAEADEFDRSFLTLDPNTAVVTSADADHLDIYGTHEELMKSFSDFVNKVKPGGNLFINYRISESLTYPKAVNRFTYSIKKGDFYADSIKAGPGYFMFNFMSAKDQITGIQIKVPGFHNVENAIAAISVSLSLGIDKEIIKKAIGSYRGVKRRFDYQINDENLVYIDDYAHHPTEINALLDSARALYPDKKITVVFQPHLYTRTRDFADGFGESLSKADELVMLNIYPARELPFEGVNSQMILDKVKLKNKVLLSDDELLPWLLKNNIQVLLTVGAGDIDRFVGPIKELLLERRSYV